MKKVLMFVIILGALFNLFSVDFNLKNYAEKAQKYVSDANTAYENNSEIKDYQYLNLGIIYNLDNNRMLYFEEHNVLSDLDILKLLNNHKSHNKDCIKYGNLNESCFISYTIYDSLNLNIDEHVRDYNKRITEYNLNQFKEYENRKDMHEEIKNAYNIMKEEIRIKNELISELKNKQKEIKNISIEYIMLNNIPEYYAIKNRKVSEIMDSWTEFSDFHKQEFKKYNSYEAWIFKRDKVVLKENYNSWVTFAKNLKKEALNNVVTDIDYILVQINNIKKDFYERYEIDFDKFKITTFNNPEPKTLSPFYLDITESVENKNYFISLIDNNSVYIPELKEDSFYNFLMNLDVTEFNTQIKNKKENIKKSLILNYEKACNNKYIPSCIRLAEYYKSTKENETSLESVIFEMSSSIPDSDPDAKQLLMSFRTDKNITINTDIIPRDKMTSLLDINQTNVNLIEAVEPEYKSEEIKIADSKINPTPKKTTYWKIGVPFIIVGLSTIPITWLTNEKIHENNLIAIEQSKINPDKAKEYSNKAKKMEITRNIMLGVNIGFTGIGILLSAIPKKENHSVTVIPTSNSIYASYTVKF